MRGEDGSDAPPARRSRRWRHWLVSSLAVIALSTIAAILIWRDDIVEALLDPKVPWTVYRPPPPPNYSLAGAWARLPRDRADRVDVFFVAPTTFDGGRDWNGSIADARAIRRFDREIAPNYAAPFNVAGRVFAPFYRQASLYTSLSLFDDAIEARQFAYGDIRRAFDYFLGHFSRGRPFILAGVEQGGVLAERLLTEVIARDPDLRRRLVAAYLQATAAPADLFHGRGAISPCRSREQSGCVLAWDAVVGPDYPRILRIYRRALAWDARGRLTPLNGRPILCVNPLLGAETEAHAPARLNVGAANATGLEWGARPGYLARQVDARCLGGILRVGAPRSGSLRPSGGWADRLRVPSYNLFWGDIAADAVTRTSTWLRNDGARR